MRIFEKRVEQISVVEWTGKNKRQLTNFCPDIRFYDSMMGEVAALDKKNNTERANIGDFIAKNPNGSFCVIRKLDLQNDYIEVI
ncbi:MAG: hypothetical protein KBT03_03190 [Bacteroidales bacterium]|nr:hypothetical protein [Candidatus Scybalousia scybalohippi]